MGVELKTASSLPFAGGLGLALGNGHAYAAGAVLGLSLGVGLVMAGGILVLVGLKKLIDKNNKKAKAAKP